MAAMVMVDVSLCRMDNFVCSCSVAVMVMVDVSLFRMDNLVAVVWQ